MSSINTIPKCPVCGGDTTQGITPASGRWCIPNECDRLTQEDREALLQLPMKERLRSIDVMKGRRTITEKELGVKDSIDKLLDDLDRLWDEPTQPMFGTPICLHTKTVVMNGGLWCADCNQLLGTAVIP